MKLCDYGCGQEAKHQFKNNKWCCSISTSKCPSIKNNIERIEGIKKNHKGMKGRNHSEDSKLKNSLSHIGKKHSDKTKEKMRKNFKGNTGKTFSDETKEKMRLIRKGKTYQQIFGETKTEEIKNKIRDNMLNGLAKYLNSFPRNQEKIEKLKKVNQEKMLKNGKYIRSFIKKISNEEIKLRNLVKELYPHCEFQYPVFNYSLDVAIPDYKIAIEYDGYYHFDTEEHKEYHKFRQEKIESEGWKFLRYTMFDKFPDKNQIQKDIQETIK